MPTNFLKSCQQQRQGKDNNESLNINPLMIHNLDTHPDQ